MPSRHSPLPAGLVVALLLPGCMWTPQHRRKVGAGVLVGGVAVAVAGFAVMDHYSEGREGPGFAPNDGFLPMLGGLAVGASGMLGAAFGGGLIVSGWVQEVREWPESEPPQADLARAERDRVKHDQSACIAWRSSYDAEGDPGRRQILVASRPGHCAPRLAPPDVRP